jgi:predicted DNA-binding transcriptional regulator YafY
VRAARLLDMLLLLHRRGRMTADDLATTLEVSPRTVLRDVEALSEAGVPIYTARGSGGGIELLEGFTTYLTGLTDDEADCLFLIGQPEVAHRLGLGKPTRSARDKLSLALPAAAAQRAESLATWFLHDPDPAAGHRIPHGELRRIARSIAARRRIELTFPAAEPMLAEPLGLVLKAGSWYLITTGPDPSPRTCTVIALDLLQATRLTTQHFQPPDGFVLHHFWANHLATHPAVPDPNQQAR